MNLASFHTKKITDLAKWCLLSPTVIFGYTYQNHLEVLKTTKNTLALVDLHGKTFSSENVKM